MLNLILKKKENNALKLIQINMLNFNEYKDLIKNSEKIYSKKLRTSITDYKKIIFEKNSITFILFYHENYVGNIIGCSPINDIKINNYGVIKKEKIIYIYNILVLPYFQGLGYGNKLFEKFVNKAIEQKYEYVSGNFRLNASYKIIKKYNIIYEKKIKNWENSNEDFMYCIIKI
ncbi:MAG: GNAT family N-acetyltransferase [Nanoarchaeota archaeon]